MSSGEQVGRCRTPSVRAGTPLPAVLSVPHHRPAAYPFPSKNVKLMRSLPWGCSPEAAPGSVSQGRVASPGVCQMPRPCRSMWLCAGRGIGRGIQSCPVLSSPLTYDMLMAHESASIP